MPPQQPPTYLDDQGNEIKTYLDDSGNEISEPGILSRAWSALNEPLTTAPSRYGRAVSEYVNPERAESGLPYYGGKAAEFTGDILSGLTSPLNVGTAALTGGAGLAGKAGLSTVARVLGMAGRTAAVPVAAEGVYNVLEQPTMTGKALGALETAGGVAGMKYKPTIRPRTVVPTVEKAVAPTVAETVAKEAPSLEQQFATMMESKGATTQPVVKVGRATINQNELATAKQVISDYDSTIDMTKMKPADIIKQGRQIDPQKFEELPTGLRSVDNTEAKLGKPIEQATPNEIKTTVPQEDIARSIKDSSTELQQDPSNWEKIRNAQRAWLTSWDFSAPGRQGLPLVLEKSYWTSFKPMFQSWKSADAYKNVMQSIENRPYFKPTIGDRGAIKPSFAQKAGLDLSDLKTHKEEMFVGDLAGKLPMVARSERAYSAYLNKLRADTFEKLVDLSKATGRDPETDLVLAKQLAHWVNIRTGKGNIGDWGRTGNRVLNEVFFAPRLTASRFQTYNQVFNPWSYAKMDPMLRRQTLKSALGMVGAGITLNQLSRLPGAVGFTDKPMEQSYDVTSPDFMKAKIGPTRFDPWGGFQQPAVALGRIVLGKSTGATGNVTDLTEKKFGRATRWDIAERYMWNRLAPIPHFIYSWGTNTSFTREGKPTEFNLPHELVNSLTPIVAQDLWDIYKTDPGLLPYGVPAATFGVGTQTYGR